MLKFLRKYQKWMLVVFCAGLMVAFLAPQAVQQFTPQPGAQTRATLYDGEIEINQTLLQKTSEQIKVLGSFGLDPFAAPGLRLIPDTNKDEDDALIWIMIQAAADKHNLGSSQVERFQLMAPVFEAETEEQLEENAEKRGYNLPYVYELADQYLKAEQFRQLVAGVEYTKPTMGGENPTGSPGVRRLLMINEVSEAIFSQIQQTAQNFGQTVETMDGRQLRMLQNMIAPQIINAYLPRLAGHGRVSSDEVRRYLQYQLTQLDLSAAELKAEDFLDDVTVSEDDAKALFKRFAEYRPGEGPEFGLGYREPDFVKLEALHIPIEAVREREAELIEEEALAEDEDAERGKNEFEFYNDFKKLYDAATTYADGTPKLKKGRTPKLDAEIKAALTEYRTQRKVIKIAQAAREALIEQSRTFERDGKYRVLPEGFVPMPLKEVADQIEKEFGVRPKIVKVNDFVSAKDIGEEGRFAQTMLQTIPKSKLRIPSMGAGRLLDEPVYSASPGGQPGLFSTQAVALQRQVGQSEPAMRSLGSLGQYILTAKPFITESNKQNETGLQVGLPGPLLLNVTGSAYVFRLTDTQASRTATDFDKVAEQVREDARKVAAYKMLVEKKDELVKQAAASKDTVSVLLPKPGDDEDPAEAAKLNGLTRAAMGNPRGLPTIAGGSSLRVVQKGFETAETLMDAGGLDAKTTADRLFTHEMPGQFTLLVVRVDDYRPLTRDAYRSRASSDAMLFQAYASDLPPGAEQPLSLEAMMRYTGLVWEDGFGPSEDDDEDGANAEE